MSTQPLAGARLRHGLALPGANSLAWPLVAIVLVLALHLSNALGRAINWDEFWHYSQTVQMQRGELTAPLQTLLMRLFGWTTWLPGDNVDRIVGARLAILLFVGATAAAIYALALRFASRGVALACALAWLSAGFVLQHATSFRTDTIAAALLTASLAVMARSRLGLPAMLLVAGLAALATLLTIKSVLYAPAFAGIAWLRWQEAARSRDATLRLLALAAMAAGLFALFYSLHAASLPDAPNAPAAAVKMASNSAGTMFRPFTIPHPDHALKAILVAPLLGAALLLLPILLRRAEWLTGPERIALAGLAVPITCVLFYQNSYAYFYAFILPPVAIACLVSLHWMMNRYSLAWLSAGFALTAFAIWMIEEREIQQRQRQIVSAADQIFPTPVAYFDYPGMLGHFPKANAFLTHWGAEGYRLSGESGSMTATLRRRVVPLVVENREAFTAVLRTDDPVPQFQPQDVDALRDNYVEFWGPFWVAGKSITPKQGATDSEFLVPGEYTVEGTLELDGDLLANGQVVPIERGRHRLRAPDGPARLVWGNHLTRPSAPPPPLPYWTQW